MCHLLSSAASSGEQRQPAVPAVAIEVVERMHEKNKPLVIAGLGVCVCACATLHMWPWIEQTEQIVFEW